jgi:arsenate reductase
VEIWVNPACSKCRAATSALDEAGIEYTVRRYLEDPPTRAELEDVLARLGLEPWDITRPREASELDTGLLDVPKDAEHRDRWLDALAAHPELIQRPIITADDGTTVVGRDPGSLAKVLPRGADQPLA